MRTLREAVRHSLHSGSMSSLLLPSLLPASFAAALGTAARENAVVADDGRDLQTSERMLPRPPDAVNAVAVDAVLRTHAAVRRPDQCCTACMCCLPKSGC